MSDTLGPHGLRRARPPCPSTTPGAYSDWCPLSQWCHPTISPSVVPFSSCLQPFPASRSFQMSQFFTSGGQSIGASISASVLPMNTQDWFVLGFTGLISIQAKGLFESSPTPQFKRIHFLMFSLRCGPTLNSVYNYWKNHTDLCLQSNVSAF